MAKDPRFNFYPDNWIGGTEGFTLEQEGAYLSLIILQSKVGFFTQEQAIDKLMQRTRGNTAVCTTLWNFLKPKFKIVENRYHSERLELEMNKSKKHSEKQKDRINKRWKDKKGITAVDTVVDTVVIPDNGSGSGINIMKKGIGGTGERERMDYLISFRQECLNRQIWSQQFCLTTGVQPDDLPQVMTEFNSHAFAMGKTITNLSDYQDYATKWRLNKNSRSKVSKDEPPKSIGEIKHIR